MEADLDEAQVANLLMGVTTGAEGTSLRAVRTLQFLDWWGE